MGNQCNCGVSFYDLFILGGRPLLTVYLYIIRVERKTMAQNRVGFKKGNY